MELSDAYKSCYLIYNRKSTDDADNQRNSLAYQRQRNVEYARRESLPLATDLTIPGFCADGIIEESHSGFKEDEQFDILQDGSVQYRILRPKFLKLAELLKARKVRGAIFLSWDRASRNPQDDLVIKKLIRLGCDIRFGEANYEKTSAGDLHRDIDSVFSNHYSRTIGEKVRNAQDKLRAERRCVYAAPIGYLDRGSDSKPLDPERAPLVKRIFELYATEEWSIRQLAKWAREQGLTKKPARRKRTKEEKADNVELDSIPKVARPVDHKTIEYILSNPFYIGKIKIGEQYEESNAHQALIDSYLFLKVQEILKKKCVTVVYLDKPFYTYRELARCSLCGRAYSPYRQKGIVYYRSRCKDACENTDPNMTENEMHAAVQSLLDGAYLTDEELMEVERRAKGELAIISEKRGKALAALHAKQRAIVADLEYLTENRITLLRTAAMDAAAIHAEQERLAGKLSAVNKEIEIYATSASEMLAFVLRFSELMKNAGLYFKHALDSERREMVTFAFTELRFANRRLTGYAAKDGFTVFLGRNAPLVAGEMVTNPQTGSPDYLFSELCAVYSLVRKAIEGMRRLSFFKDL